ncbi:RloB family protein [Lentzea sp. DG1S-22]|nr:RloB family protein [Lentzea sp. DG1S-22]WVH85083.1 RloB family protein [Lentzea sp. DG1S-22]
MWSRSAHQHSSSGTRRSGAKPTEAVSTSTGASSTSTSSTSTRPSPRPARRGFRWPCRTPCFEVWLILHFADCTAGISSPRAAAEKLRKHLPGYAKGALDFAVLAERVDKAVERAKALGSDNPSSDMWRLVEVVRKH